MTCPSSFWTGWNSIAGLWICLSLTTSLMRKGVHLHVCQLMSGAIGCTSATAGPFFRYDLTCKTCLNQHSIDRLDWGTILTLSAYGLENGTNDVAAPWPSMQWLCICKNRATASSTSTLVLNHSLAWAPAACTIGHGPERYFFKSCS